MKNIIKIIGMAILVGMAMPVFAESAPVYDADDMSPMDAQFDPQNQAQAQGDQQGDILPPPPAQQEGTFVPMQQAQGPIDPVNPDVAAPAIPMSMDQRIKRMEQQLSNIQNNESSARIDSLQDQVQSLRGQVEQLSHQLEQIQNQQKSMFSDLEKRLVQQKATASVSPTIGKPSDVPVAYTANAASAGADMGASGLTKAGRKLAGAKPAKVAEAAPVNTPVTPVTNQPNVAEEQQIYQTAYNLIKAKKYSDAINVLQNMLQKYPSGQFASNAHYWLGELYGLLGKNDQALAEFGTVVKTYPDSPRISDAQLKVGLIYAAQFKWTDAKNAFKKVINHYPGTTSARLASEQLKQIKQAGH